ncbi:hypothetical protein BV25DRAFT_1529125 [Artomyces pyxidatus]|uniref:Uncharacterized protein n=1 Tax=Artomyces pyxidatus TaxID=48021 RepID=A0ACB8TD71_9AGAM|nr:hypothetical protein BV25DRAFT_1529125 [Artomyces pyxidatus]
MGLMTSLPNDILLEILESLDWRDLIACRRTCHRLDTLAGTAVPLQYTIELAACGMLDGERGLHTLPIRERLDRLKLHQDAWLNLTWTKNNDLAHLLGRTYSASVTGLALAFPSRLDSTLLLQTVPSFLRGIDEDHKILNGPTGIPVQLDLSQDLWISMDIPPDDTSDITCYLKSISTGDAHSSAHNEGCMRFSRRWAGVDCCGNYILLSRHGVDFTSTVLVHNWKTGIVESEKREYWSIGTEEYLSRNGWFLDESYILLDMDRLTSDATGPRTFQSSSAGCLVVVPISPSDTRSYRFFLPDFFQDIYWAHRIIPRCTGGFVQGCFYDDPADRLLSLRPSLRTSSSGPQFVIDIPVRTFTAYIQAHPGDAGAPVVVPWEEWGPRGTRITLETATGPAFSPRTSVHGMRRLSVRADSRSSGTVTVLDYHPRRVARALARGDAKVTHGGTVGNVVTLLPCIETTVPLPEGPAHSLAGHMLGVWLCENGVLLVESLLRDKTITNAWAYSI